MVTDDWKNMGLSHGDFLKGAAVAACGTVLGGNGGDCGRRQVSES